MAKSINAPADKSPGSGHNGPDEGVFLKHVRKIIEANQKLEDAKSARQAIRKLAKADGIELKKLDAVVTMSDWEPGEVRDHFLTLNKYAIWIGLPVGHQADIFEDLPEAALPPEQWRHKGFIAATTGKGSFGEAPADCPPGDCTQAYLQGVHSGQERIAAAMKPPEPEKPPEVDPTDEDEVARQARALKKSDFMQRGPADAEELLTA